MGLRTCAPCDFYDTHMLWTLLGKDCNIEMLRKALDATCGKRGNLEKMTRWEWVLDEVEKRRADVRTRGQMRSEEPLCL